MYGFLKITGIILAIVSFLSVGIILYLNEYGEPAGRPIGNSRSGFKAPSDNISITPKQAIELANPYLEESYRLRRIMRNEKENISELDAVIWMSYGRKIYFISKDHYPSYTPGYYFRHAVQVDALTGKVTPPK